MLARGSFTIVALMLFCGVASADTVVITSGTIEFRRSATITTLLHFSGSNFNVSGASDGLGGMACQICSAGSTITPLANSGQLGSFDLFGTVTFAGRNYTFTSGSLPSLPSVNGTGQFRLDGASVIAPFGSSPTATVTAPFTIVEASLGGFAVDGGFGLTFLGSGTATVVLTRFSPTLYSASSITYTFQTPEPSSIVLLSAGFAGLGILKRRRYPRR